MKILFLDIETAFKIGALWKMWNTNVPPNFLIKDWYILCWCAKWRGESEILSDSLVNYPKQYKKDPENDIEVVKSLWGIINEADIIVAHNGDKFDLPSSNTRMVYHNMLPPAKYKTVDTMKIAKRAFKFTFNRLDYLGDFLGVGRKLQTGGGDLWTKVIMNKDPKSWDKMVRYCKQDVRLLERVYKKLRAWDHNHPNLSLYMDDPKRPVCNVCGSKRVWRDGSYHTPTNIYQRYRCVECGHGMRALTGELKKEDKVNLLVSVK